ncbi:MAG: aminoacyl-tRNA hydrolase [Actinomycetes bacterium]
MTSSPWLVVGLGNPGPEYSATRHNIGAMVVEALASRYSSSLAKHRRAHASAADVRIGGERVELLVPRSYMNESGGPVKAAADFAKVPADRIIVVHDELDLPFGSLRCKLGGGDNGHNGLKSLRRSLDTGDFYRVRFGIGRPPGRQDPAAFVLRPFGSTERRELEPLVARASDAIETLVVDGLEVVQNRFND